VFRAALPGPDQFDMLVVMGGPMNVYEEEAHPWLRAEKTLIREAIDRGSLVLGVCLGAQIIAAVLGAQVTRNTEPEIGWFPVDLTDEATKIPVFARFPRHFSVLHWHGDTFGIPEDSVHIAKSAACVNQAFAFDGGRVIGLQFHLEETRGSLGALVAEGRAELRPSPWVSSEGELLSQAAPFAACRDLLFNLLDGMVARPRADEIE